MSDTTALLPVIASYVRAVNAYDTDAILAAFAEDAFVNDVRREFAGTAAIRRWAAKEIVGDKVTMEVTEIVDHYGDQIVRARYDGQYDKTNLHGDLILTNYFTVCDGRITSLVIVRNEPAY